MSSYSENVIEHAQRPRNFGRMGDPHAVGKAASDCGDWVEFMLKTGEDGRISEARYLCYGCASALASSSVLSELALGRSVVEAELLGTADILRALGAVPEDKQHCNQLGLRAFKAALEQLSPAPVVSAGKTLTD